MGKAAILKVKGEAEYYYGVVPRCRTWYEVTLEGLEWFKLKCNAPFFLDDMKIEVDGTVKQFIKESRIIRKLMKTMETISINIDLLFEASEQLKEQLEKELKTRRTGVKGEKTILVVPI